MRTGSSARNARARHPIHPLGTYFLHGDGRPRRVHILDIGLGAKAGKIHVDDGRSRFWVARAALSRSAKPAPRPRPAPGPLQALLATRRA